MNIYDSSLMRSGLITSGKHWAKTWRWKVRRMAAARRWGKLELLHSPIVLGNAMPKSGSHLINQVLQGLPHVGPFVNPGFPPVNRTENNQKLNDQQVMLNLEKMKPGDIGYGYIGSQEPFVSLLTRDGRATIFVYRDPRDMIISHIFYATQMHKNHWMHKYYTEHLHSMEERINAAICGVEDTEAKLTPIRERYEGYIGWLDQPQILCLRFEDLILKRENALLKLLDYLGNRGFSLKMDGTVALKIINQSIKPGKSGTFRKGKPGNWVEYFTPANIQCFKEKTGDLLIQLGYEGDENW